MEGSSKADQDGQQLVFRVEDQRYAIVAKQVLEVVKISHITRVPNGPQALLGIANLRGRPIPVLSMGQVLNGRKDAPAPDAKIIVYDHHGAVGLLVDDVLRLATDASSSAVADLPDRLDSAFKVPARVAVDKTRHSASAANRTDTELRHTTLLTFRVGAQLYGLPLEHVREVSHVTTAPSALPNAVEAVLGVVPFRGGFLPIVSLASLLGLHDDRAAGADVKIIVINYAGRLLGLSVGAVDAIRRIPEHSIGNVPALLQRGGGEAQVEAIARADDDQLISILTPTKLYTHRAVTDALGQTSGETAMETSSNDEERSTEQFLIFNLGDENYGLPIKSVDEVVRVPPDITRVPNAPQYVLGLMNLRGRALPLIDQRTRFDASMKAAGTGARAIIVQVGELHAGFVVDGVTEVASFAQHDLSGAPEFASEQTDVFDRIAYVSSGEKMILLIDPQALLSRAERDLVASLADGKTAVANT